MPLKKVFLRPLNRSRLKTLLVKHHYRRQGFMTFMKQEECCKVSFFGRDICQKMLLHSFGPLLPAVPFLFAAAYLSPDSPLYVLHISQGTALALTSQTEILKRSLSHRCVSDDCSVHGGT